MSYFKKEKLKNKLHLISFAFKNKILTVYLLSLATFFYSCIDPVPPQFDFKEDLVIVDAIASSVPGNTFVSVKKTFIEFGEYKSKFISGCKVTLINSVTKEEIMLSEDEDSYLVSPDFRVDEGSEWELEIITPSGKTYKSLSEIVPSRVPIDLISDTYNKEMTFDVSKGKYIPGHEIRIDFQEPEATSNFYYFQYRAFEQQTYCQICFYGVLRFGECISQIDNPAAKDYYTYICDEPCWKISYNQEISLFDDAFTNGKMISKLLVGKVPLNSKQNMLVEIVQLNITEEAHKYYKTIKDIVDNNSGFNAPLPSALIGNLFNQNDLEDPVLGRFTAASGSSKSIFVKRGSIDDKIVGEYRQSQTEIFGDPLPSPITYDSPCIVGRNQTNQKPFTWPE